MIVADRGMENEGGGSAPADPATQWIGQGPPCPRKEQWLGGCQSCDKKIGRARDWKRSIYPSRTGTISSPLFTPNAPPGRKSFWISAISNASPVYSSSLIVLIAFRSPNRRTSMQIAQKCRSARPHHLKEAEVDFNLPIPWRTFSASC